MLNLTGRDTPYICSAASSFLARAANASRKLQHSTSQIYLSEKNNIPTLRLDVNFKNAKIVSIDTNNRNSPSITNNSLMSRGNMLHVSDPRNISWHLSIQKYLSIKKLSCQSFCCCGNKGRFRRIVETVSRETRRAG
jgi:hypothetical protein